MPNPDSVRRFGDLRIETRPNRFVVDRRDPDTGEWRRVSTRTTLEGAIACVLRFARERVHDLQGQLEEALDDLVILEHEVEREREKRIGSAG